jgi:hypothetical protein
MSLPDILGTARRIESPLFQGARELFTAKDGKMKYGRPGVTTHYIPTGNPAKAGIIVIDPMDVEGQARFFGSPLGALRTLLIHEMAHSLGELQAKATRPIPSAPPTSHIEWCYMHEARATVFAYRVAKELKSKGLPAYVTAPTSTMDVFDAMAEAERRGANLLMLAKSYYAASTYYTMLCRSQVPGTAQPPAQGMPVVRVVGKRPSRAVGARR